MSNETDLDWLARNVHKWVPNELLRMKPCDNGNGTFRASWCYSDEGGFTKDQWLARRAELQSKPTEWPKRANWLAQHEDGEWTFYADDVGCPPQRRDDGCWYSDRAAIRSHHIGEVLGDWRDTLERRPADLSEPAVTERLTEAAQAVLAAAPALMDEKFRFDRDDWFERGELPPVGIECEIFLDGGWERVFIAGVSRAGNPVAEFGPGNISECEDCKFRPLPADREQLKEVLSMVPWAMFEKGLGDRVADAILAAGFSLRGK